LKEGTEELFRQIGISSSSVASVEDSKEEDNEPSESPSSIQSKGGLESSDSEYNHQIKKSSKLPSIDVFFSGDDLDTCKLIGRKRLPENSQLVIKKQMKEDDCTNNSADILRQLFFKGTRTDA